MVVPRQEGPAASLASYQLEVLRDKNRELTQRLHDLYAIAQDNERLAVQTQQLTLNLLRQDSAGSTVRAMAARLSEDFNGDPVRVVLLEPVPGLDDADWLQVIPRDVDVLVPFRDCLAVGGPFCGRLPPATQPLLSGPP